MLCFTRTYFCGALPLSHQEAVAFLPASFSTTFNQDDIVRFIESCRKTTGDTTMTQNHVTGMENAAVSVLKRAVELDHSGRLPESLVCYQEGIQLLIDVLKGLCLLSGFHRYMSGNTETGAITVSSCFSSCEG